MNPRHSFCHHCGSSYGESVTDYPRACASCGAMVWTNPIPVPVLLVPVVQGERTGLLVIRRGIEPQKGKLALVGGFLEEHESWQEGGAREVLEDTAVVVDPESVEPFWFASPEPQPGPEPMRILLFGKAEPVDASAFAVHDEENQESPERGAIFGPDGLEDVFAFPVHIEAARRYFASVGVEGPHAYEAL